MSITATVEDQVFEFVASFRGIRRERQTPATTLLGDLGVDGFDGMDLIEAFAERFHVDCSTYQHRRHFGPEAAMLPWQPLGWLWRWATKDKRTPEELARKAPVRMSDLIAAAEKGRWVL